jgi:hypothetical protein
MRTVFSFPNIQFIIAETILTSIQHPLFLICVSDPDIYRFAFEGRESSGHLQQRLDSPFSSNFSAKFSSKFPNAFQMPKNKKPKRGKSQQTKVRVSSHTGCSQKIGGQRKKEFVRRADQKGSSFMKDEIRGLKTED